MKSIVKTKTKGDYRRVKKEEYIGELNRHTDVSIDIEGILQAR